MQNPDGGMRRLVGAQQTAGRDGGQKERAGRDHGAECKSADAGVSAQTVDGDRHKRDQPECDELVDRQDDHAEGPACPTQPDAECYFQYEKAADDRDTRLCVYDNLLGENVPTALFQS